MTAIQFPMYTLPIPPGNPRMWQEPLSAIEEAPPPPPPPEEAEQILEQIESEVAPPSPRRSRGGSHK